MSSKNLVCVCILCSAISAIISHHLSPNLCWTSRFLFFTVLCSGQDVPSLWIVVEFCWESEIYQQERFRRVDKCPELSNQYSGGGALRMGCVRQSWGDECPSARRKRSGRYSIVYSTRGADTWLRGSSLFGFSTFCLECEKKEKLDRWSCMKAYFRLIKGWPF